MLETQPVGPPRASTCARTSRCSLRGADELLERLRRARSATTPTSTCARFECLGACDIAPMASVDGVYVGPLDARRGPRRRRRRSARGEEPLPDQAARSAAKCADPGRHRAVMTRAPALQGHRRARPAHARRLRAPRRLRGAAQGAGDDAATRSSHELEASGLRGRGGAGFAMGKKASFLPKGAMDKYLVCNADESEPGTFKDRELMQKSPHMLIEGMIIAAYAARREPRVHLHPRRVRASRPTSSTRRSPRRTTAGYLGERILGSDLSLSLVRAPRRRRLHLRRGDGAARLAGGQARQPAPQAAVPGQPGPLPGPDADQQRRDARDRRRTSSGWAATEYAKIGAESSTGTKLVSVSGNVAAPGQLRDRARASPSREIIYGLAGGPPEGREVKLWFPGGSSVAGADRATTSTSPTTSTRWPRPARCSARARSSSSTTRHSVVDVALKTGEVLPPRVVRQVHAVPRGHELDGEDARAHRRRRGDADGPRHHGLGPGAASSATACACSATRWRCRSAR